MFYAVCYSLQKKILLIEQRKVFRSSLKQTKESRLFKKLFRRLKSRQEKIMQHVLPETK